jgi:hypothetical protein
MRKWSILLLLVATPWLAMAAKSVSIEQFEQMLFADRGKSDEKVAERLADVVLTERVSPARLAKWEKEFPGSHTREALMKLSDEVAFLDPPASDVLRDPPPDNETQEKMLALASDYVRATIGRLPNFYATRETTHFEGTPEQQSAFSFARNLGLIVNQTRDLEQEGGSKWLHTENTTSVTVTYRDGQEVNDLQAENRKKENRTINGLTTTGEFGPILGVVLGDAIQNQVIWARWEQGASDPVAVFSYAVRQNDSHYSVQIPDGTKLDDVRPAYHGEIAIDPATGAILRVSAIADLVQPNQMMRAAILVEYAPVEIGDRSCNCPVHGVAFSKVPVAGAKPEPSSSAVEVQTQLNDVTFTHYHQFGSEARIVGNGSGANTGGAPASTGEPAAAGSPPAATGAASGAPPSGQGR